MMADGKKKSALDIIKSYDGPPVRIMEVCGTHTHEIFRLGLRQILPKEVTLISGPGCPVCVTPVSFIDEAIWLALESASLTKLSGWRWNEALRFAPSATWSACPARKAAWPQPAARGRR